MKRSFWGALIFFLLAGASSSAWAFDCAKAYLPVDFVICSDPAVLKANEAHEKAWYETRARLNDAEKQELLNDQRRWLKEYPPRCGVPAQGKRLATIPRDAQLCVSRALEERRAFLEQYHSSATEVQSSTTVQTSENQAVANPMASPDQSSAAAQKQELGQFSRIEQVDFLNFTYPIGDPEDCAGLARRTVTLRRGKFSEGKGITGVDVSLERRQILYTGLSGDNANEAVVSLVCDPHGNYVDTVIFVYTLRNGEPILLTKFSGSSTGRDYRKYYPSGFVFPISGITTTSRKLIIHRPADGSHACPINDTRFEYMWNGNGFILAGKPMKARNKDC